MTEVTMSEHNATYYIDRLTEIREKAGLPPVVPDMPIPLVSPTKNQVEEPVSVSTILYSLYNL